VFWTGMSAAGMVLLCKELMNWLAHLYLSESAPGFIVGSLAADFLDGEWSSEDSDVLAGIARHQQVEQFTDAHPLWLSSRSRIDGRVRHARGAVVDVFYDHLLAVHWDRFSAERLDDFTARVHSVLEAHMELCPPKMRAALPRFIAENWLQSYASEDGVCAALERLTRRFGGRVNLLDAMDGLKEQGTALEEEFLEFFPQLCEAARAS